MGKRKSTWLSPTKEKALYEKNRRIYKRNVIIATIVCTLLVVAIGMSAFGIVQSLRPYYAFIEIEGYGTIVIKLNNSEAPETVDAFVELAESGYYDGTLIHRAFTNKYFQAGFRDDIVVEPIKGEFSKNGVENNLSHIRGTISMSRQIGEGEGDKDFYNTATGQFFILQRDMLSMDGKYAAFGTVIEGMDIVDRICDNAKTDGNGNIVKTEQPIITAVRIERSYSE